MSASSSSHLPLRRSLDRAYALSLAVAVFMAAASLSGLLFPDRLYPNDTLRSAFLINDAVNLVVGLPILLIAMALARRGSLAGLLLWPGALAYTLYNYVVYLIGMPPGLATAAGGAIVLLSGYTFVHLFAVIDASAVQAQLAGVVPERLAGWFLLIFGVAFVARAIGVVLGEGPLPATEIGLLAADVVVSVLWMAAGILLLRRAALGYAGGLGLLFAAITLVVGLVGVLLLQPVLLDMTVAPVDLIVVAVFGLICAIPFWLYLRGVERQPPAARLG